MVEVRRQHCNRRSKSLKFKQNPFAIMATAKDKGSQSADRTVDSASLSREQKLSLLLANVPLTPRSKLGALLTVSDRIMWLPCRLLLALPRTTPGIHRDALIYRIKCSFKSTDSK